MITIIVANCQIHQILVDNKSFADILYIEMFGKMNNRKDKLKSIKTPLIGFRGESVISEGAIQLLVTIEEAPNQVTSIVEFLVLNCPSI